MAKAKLFLATDHAGFEMKNTVRDYFLEHDNHGYEVVDLGAFVLDPGDDYPELIARAAREVSRDPETHRAVVFGGSGQGEAIVANKFNNVRATVYYGGNREIIDLARQHNNTNVLSIGARFTESTEVIPLIERWLVTPFAAEPRHVRRLALIDKQENNRFWKRFIDLIRPSN